MKFYGMTGHNPGTNRLDFEWCWPKVKGQRSLEVSRSESFCEYTLWPALAQVCALSECFWPCYLLLILFPDNCSRSCAYFRDHFLRFWAYFCGWGRESRDIRGRFSVLWLDTIQWPTD